MKLGLASRALRLLYQFREIDLGGNFAGVSLRDMAIEAGLKSLYDLSYQPLSGEAHAEWSSLTTFDLRYCTNPLHGFHRVGRFRSDDSSASLEAVPVAFHVAAEAISETFSSYGVEVDEHLDRCFNAMTAAIRRDAVAAESSV